MKCSRLWKSQDRGYQEAKTLLAPVPQSNFNSLDNSKLLGDIRDHVAFQDLQEREKSEHNGLSPVAGVTESQGDVHSQNLILRKLNKFYGMSSRYKFSTTFRSQR